MDSRDLVGLTSIRTFHRRTRTVQCANHQDVLQGQDISTWTTGRREMAGGYSCETCP